MNPAILQHIQNILSKYNFELNIDQQLAVHGMAPILASKGIILKVSLEASAGFQEHLPQLGSYTNFFSLNSNMLNVLTISLINHKHIEKISGFAMAIQRFVEINYGYLLEKTREKKTIPKDQVSLHYLKAAVFLLDYYFFSGDLRYLNTCLKLMDYNWIFSVNNIKNEYLTLQTLLECRLWLLTEYALSELEKNEKSSNILP